MPHTALSAAALRGVIESFVLREGTDYGERDVPHEAKVAQVLRQLERGEARIMFGRGEKQLEEKKIKKQERWVVTSENKAEPSEYLASGDFIAWNKTVNENFDALHGDSLLPKPVERYRARTTSRRVTGRLHQSDSVFWRSSSPIEPNPSNPEKTVVKMKKTGA